jgi:outer membrane protein assembly factor BamA
MTPPRVLLVAILLCPCVSAGFLHGSEENAGKAAAPRSGFVVAPVVYYTPETRLAWGIVGIHHFRLGRIDRPSRLSHYRFNFIRTQNQQSVAQVDYELYLADDRFLIDGMTKYSYYPDRFYGIGNRTLDEEREVFTSSNWRFQLNLQRRWGDFLYAGLHLEIYDLSMREIENGGALAAGTIIGSQGGTLSGLGVFLKWDSRDNTFSPTRGAYASLFLNRFLHILGGDFSFGQLNVDARRYWPLDREQVLAAQGVLRYAWGDCPFQVLPTFGGLNLLRGFYDGRYRDRNMLAVQAEYRRPLWGRFGFCAFAGVAQVQEKASLLELGGFHSAAGFGLRYKFNQRENLNVRLDVGFAGPAPAFYLTFAEAF